MIATISPAECDVVYNGKLCMTMRKLANVLGVNEFFVQNHKHKPYFLKNLDYTIVKRRDVYTREGEKLPPPLSGDMWIWYAGSVKTWGKVINDVKEHKVRTYKTEQNAEETSEYTCSLFNDEPEDIKESPGRGGKLYTADEEAAIRVGVKLGHTNDEIAAYLRRTKGAIENVKNKLGLVSAPSHKWTKEMDITAQTLRGLGRSYEEIAKVMGVTPDAVKSRLKKLRIKAKNAEKEVTK